MAKPVILHTEASTGWGGQEIRILSEMLGIKGRGYSVLLAAPPHAAIYKRATEAGITTFGVEMGRLGFLKGVRVILKIIKSEKISIINTHSSRDSWLGSVAGRVAGKKIIRTRHISSKLKTDVLTRLIYGPLCDGIITTGTFIKKQVAKELKISPLKIHSIPTGIDVDSFIQADRLKVRAELGIPEESTVIGIAAAIRSWKGHEYILKAMPMILMEYPDTRLVIAGEGDLRYHIEKIISELGLDKSVILTGHREDIPDVVASFDISVMASYASEGVPQFALQSMAAGKPVIGTDTGGIPEVVKDGINGFIIPPKDPAGIATAAKALLSDRALMEKMGEAGRIMAIKEHTREKMLDGIEELYARLLA